MILDQDECNSNKVVTVHSSELRNWIQFGVINRMLFVGVLLSSCNGYCHRKWNWRPKIKSFTSLSVFHFMLNSELKPAILHLEIDLLFTSCPWHRRWVNAGEADRIFSTSLTGKTILRLSYICYWISSWVMNI